MRRGNQKRSGVGRKSNIWTVFLCERGPLRGVMRANRSVEGRRLLLRGVSSGQVAAFVLAILAVGCSPAPLANSSIPTLAKENYPAWCIMNPPLDYKAGWVSDPEVPRYGGYTDYTKVHVIPDAPWTEWLSCGCFDSALKCDVARLHSRWRALFWKKSPYVDHQPAWQPRLSREIAASSRCISIDDPRLRGDESLARLTPWHGQPLTWPPSDE